MIVYRFSKNLIRQALLAPFLFFIPVFIAGWLTEDYSLISQHASEITLTDFETAKLILNSGAVLTGFSCILLAFGILLHFRNYYLSSAVLLIFGISMISNGIYPMGAAMHGFYGIGLSYMILPFLACYELKNRITKSTYFSVSLICGFIVFVYFWSMLVGLDPAAYRGLTQRLASVFIFGWIAYLSFELSKLTHKT